MKQPQQPAQRRPWKRWVLLVVVLGVVGFLYVGLTQQTAVDDADYYAQATTHLEAGEIQEAVIQLKNAIRQDPDHADARFDLAEIYLRVGDGASAEKELRASERRGRSATDVYVPLLDSLRLQGTYAEMLDEPTPDGLEGPGLARALISKGAAFISLDRFDEAETVLDEALTLAPGEAGAFVGLSHVYQSRDDLQAAESAIDQALAANAEDLGALMRKGELRGLAGDIDGALAAYDVLIEAEPNHLRGRLARALALMSQNRTEDAQPDVDMVLDQMPDNPMANYLQALAFARDQQYAGALDLLEPHKDALASYLPAQVLLGSLNLVSGKLEQAHFHAQKFNSAMPGNAAGARLLAAVHVRQNAADKAIILLEPLLERNPEDYESLTLLGNAYMQARRHADAAEIYNRALSINPESTEMRTDLALSQLGTGEAESAISEFQAILEQDPGAQRAGILLVLTHIRNRDYDRAIEAATALKEQMPENPLPYNFLGTIYMGQGELETARDAFAQAIEVQPKFFPAKLNLAEIERSLGNAAEAEAVLREIVEESPGHLQASLRLSRLAFSNGDSEAGVEWLQKASETNPKAPQPLLRLVNYHLQRQEGEQALVLARQLIEAAPKNVDALDALGRAQAADDQLASAATTYRKLIDLIPNAASAHHRLGRVLASGENWDDAAESFARALELSPQFEPAWRDQMEVARRRDGLDAAMTVAVSAREALPDSAVGHVLLGDVHRLKGEDSLSTEAYRAAYEIRPTTALVGRLYQGLTRMEDHSAARSVLETWLETNPDDADTLFLYASDLIREGSYPEAIDVNEKLLERFPESAVIWNDLAWLYGEVGDERAVEYAEQAYKLSPQSAAIADTLGWLLYAKSGDLERAETLLREARSGAPNHPEIGYHLAVILNAAGNTFEAKERLRAILDSGRPFRQRAEAESLLDQLGN